MSYIFEYAADSVASRGFFDIDPPGLTGDGDVMAQYVRLVEEVGELGRALRKFEGDARDLPNVCDELADVVIVCSSIARLLNVDLGSCIHNKLAADERRGRLHGE